MPDVPSIRLNLLRSGYLLLAVGLGWAVWPSILNPAKTWELMHGVEVCMLGALGLLSVMGLRHPLRMLPLLFWELTWKAIWLLRVALPLWARRRMDADTAEAAGECLTVVIFLAYGLQHFETFEARVAEVKRCVAARVAVGHPERFGAGPRLEGFPGAPDGVGREQGVVRLAGPAEQMELHEARHVAEVGVPGQPDLSEGLLLTRDDLEAVHGDEHGDL